MSTTTTTTDAAQNINRHATENKGRCTAILMCWLLGIGALFPFNSVVTIEDYYTLLFPHYHPSRLLAFMNQPFQLAISAILVYREATVNTRRRNIIGYSIYLIGSFLVLLLNLATTPGGEGNLATYIGLCALSCAFGIGCAHVDGGMMGDLSLMRPEMVQSFLAGQGASGALTSALRLITKAVFEHSNGGLRKGAILFFVLSVLFELICLLVYAYLFPRLAIVKYYRSKAASEGSKTVSADLAAAGVLLHQQQHTPTQENPTAPAAAEEMIQNRLTTTELFRQNMDYAVGIFLTYLLTLSIFPGFLFEDTGSHHLGSWYGILLVALFNAFDLLGRYVPCCIPFLRMESRSWLFTAVVSRFIFIPGFYFAAKYVGEGWMITLTSLLGFTTGYLTICLLTSAPKGYKGPEQNALGNLLIMFLQAGVFAGLTLGWLWLIGKGW